jgi:putative restriction endonuclease
LVNLFQDDPNHANRALQIWQILISKASNRQTVRFVELAEMVGIVGGVPLPIFAPLHLIGYYCEHHNLPLLDDLVVNSGGVPGEGFFEVHPDADPNAERERVFNFDWFGIVPPTPEELQ